jgi:ribosome-associated heat shock protein Hsp15
MTDRVRIDKWLWAARFFKTRAAAHEAIELGRVRVDGERIKPAREMHAGDHLTIELREHRIEIVVLALSAQRGPATVARTLYEETADSVAKRARRSEVAAAEPARTIRGRPTKREGRQLRRLRES